MESTSPTSPPSKPVPRWVAALSLAGLLLVLIGSIELAARFLTSTSDNPTLQRIVRDYSELVAKGPEWIRFIPDAELGYAPRPNFTLAARTGTGMTRHNAAGFRNDREFAEKASGTLRIACYGASTTYGVGVDDNGDTYPAQLEAILNGPDKPPGWNSVEVWNLGVGGYTSREILGAMKRTLPVLQPDVVLIQNAINDVIPRFYPNYKPDYSHFRTVFRPLDVSALEQLLCRSHAWLMLSYGAGWVKPLSLQAQTQQPMPEVDAALANLDQNPATGFEQNLAEAVKLAQEAGCQVWLLSQAYLDVPDFAGPNEASRRLESGYRRGLLEHTAIVAGLAEKTGAGYVRVGEEMPPDRPYYTDPIHMSAPGNRVKAAIIARTIGPKLPSPAP